MQVAARHLQQGTDTRYTTAGPQPLDALVYQDAVIAVQWHHVGHRPQRHQVKQHREVRFSDTGLFKPALFTQACAQRQHDIERHPDTGQIFTGKGVVTQVWIDDGISRR